MCCSYFHIFWPGTMQQQGIACRTSKWSLLTLWPALTAYSHILQEDKGCVNCWISEFSLEPGPALHAIADSDIWVESHHRRTNSNVSAHPVGQLLLLIVWPRAPWWHERSGQDCPPRSTCTPPLSPSSLTPGCKWRLSTIFCCSNL